MTEKQQNNLSGDTGHYIEDQWISLSDLMTGLMMIFMLIALAYMIKVQADQSKITEIAVLYDEVRNDLYQDLSKEFEKDLPKWGAELDKDLTVRFKEPEVLFDTGEDKLKPRFKEILKDFFPRYIKIISSEKYRNSIKEIRIEGHTSSIWNGETSPDDAYFKNMDLSQSRTRDTLQYVLSLPEIGYAKSWIKYYVTANGLSSSRPIYDQDKTENYQKSQRVEFRVVTDAESKMAKILELESGK